MKDKVKGLLLFILEIAVIAGILYFVRGKLVDSHNHEVSHYMPMLIAIAVSFLHTIPSISLPK